MRKYRLLKSGEITDTKQGDQFQVSPKKWVPTARAGRLIHDGLVGAYRRPIRKPNGAGSDSPATKKDKTMSTPTTPPQQAEPALGDAPGSRLVWQRRFIPNVGIPKLWSEWHDHPEPNQIAWEPGEHATLSEKIKAACKDRYEREPRCEYRMVRRTDETLWEYSAHAIGEARADSAALHPPTAL